MSALAIGDEVTLPQGHQAILRWTGRIAGRGNVEYAGVELTGSQAQSHGKHSGEFNGRKYFETTTPGTGLFVSYTQLVSANLRTPCVAQSNNGAVSSISDIAQSHSPYSSPCSSILKGRIGPSLSRSPSPISATKRLSVVNSSLINSLSHRSSPIDGQRGSPNGSRRESQELRLKLTESESRAKKLKQILAERRAEFRQTLKQLHDYTDGLARNFEEKIKEIQENYDRKLASEISANKSLSYISDAGVVEEQRIALAAMQNRLLAESEKKEEQLKEALDEVASLKRELALAKRGDNDSDKQLESLLKDLETQDERLKSMQTSVAEADDLKREVEHLRERNAELELELASANSISPPPSKQVRSPTSSQAGKQTPQKSHKSQISESFSKVELLEKQFEEQLLREDSLDAELQSLRVHSIDSSDSASTVADLMHNEKNPITSIPRDVSNRSPLHATEEATFDLAAGREDWCALCERQGHTAVECPY